MNVMGLGAMIYDVAKCDNNGVYCSVAMSWEDDCRYERVNELIQRRKRLRGGCRCGCLLWQLLLDSILLPPGNDSPPGAHAASKR